MSQTLDEKAGSITASKQDSSHVENGAQPFTDSDEISQLPEQYKNFLTERHGSYNLDPLPEMTDADPYNWPQWKKRTNLALVAFHAMMGTFTAASIQCAFVDIAMDLKVSVQRTTYLTSLVIAILGGAPLFWRPLCDRFGRRPIFLLSLVFSLVGNIGCAKSPSFGTMALCRAITAFFISPAAAIGSATVSEMFFKKDRARHMGVWTLMVTLGVPIAPFLFGFAAQRVGYRWIYWVLAMVNGVQFILYGLFGQETLYLRNGQANPESTPSNWRSLFRRIDPAPLRFSDFYQPLRFFAYPSVIIPAAAYAMIFLWGSVMITIELPQIFPEKFGLDTQATGLQFLGVIIGSLIGEQIGGFMSDTWMSRRQKQTGSVPPAEYRLWLAYSGHVLVIVGVVVFTVMTEKLTSWNVTPVVGCAIAAAGNQIVTTVNITYAVDRHRVDAGSVGVFITFVRQVWGFIGPFWFPQMFANVGFYKATGIEIALIIGVSTIPTILLQWKGGQWH